MDRFCDLYKKKIVPSLKEKFGYKNLHQVPKMEKVVLSMGVGAAVTDGKKLISAAKELELIAGQKSITTKAKKSISSFKLRAGMPIGCKVTLRKSRMYEFLERLVLTALPRVKDFRGFSNKDFDGRGNFSFGIKEHIVFPEIDYDKISEMRGLGVCCVTSARNNEEGQALLEGFFMPFIK
ncbi:50S ribosomal protein L5 [Candidatus Sneabacter namystus]|uniref:Large ribosomal subunit protein uL5 n=1 Tax=Candidatus Sneabacter namystus TaxID=2601646 RepID=A0A5C0UI44_9RICK|nr:50S ribosomal protein L5 [Candidatus Sneabacter namystus]QEK39778.1 50S ribosomal protein L5 [Candidatus Sneabacter namystus]